jgi:hypothetical protein
MLVAVAAYSDLYHLPALEAAARLADADGVPALGAMLSAIPLLIWEASNGEARFRTAQAG